MASASPTCFKPLRLVCYRAIFKEWCELLEGLVSQELTTRAQPLAFIANAETDTELWCVVPLPERLPAADSGQCGGPAAVLAGLMLVPRWTAATGDRILSVACGSG